jgi:hypothetical protein
VLIEPFLMSSGTPLDSAKSEQTPAIALQVPVGLSPNQTLPWGHVQLGSKNEAAGAAVAAVLADE